MGAGFKYGKWQCLGKTIALLELNKIFVEVSDLEKVGYREYADRVSRRYYAASTSHSSIPRSPSGRTRQASSYSPTSWFGLFDAQTRAIPRL